MSETTSWREIVASSLDWEQAHVSLDRAIDDLRGNSTMSRLRKLETMKLFSNQVVSPGANVSFSLCWPH